MFYSVIYFSSVTRGCSGNIRDDWMSSVLTLWRQGMNVPNITKSSRLASFSSDSDSLVQ